MPDAQDEAFLSYTRYARSRLIKKDRTPLTKGSLHLLTNNAMELRTLVDTVESEPLFHKLITETRSAFSGDYHGKSEWAWEPAVKNFFRRSGYYVDSFEGRDVDEELLLDDYHHAFQNRETQITLLAPLEFVYFSVPTMNFGTFQIRQFDRNELDSILQNQANRIFYSWAAVDTEILQDYWFVQLTEVVPTPRLGRVYIDLNGFRRVGIEYTKYPKSLEKVLQALTLYDWQANWWKESPLQGQRQQQEDPERGWFGFHIPFVLRVDDNWLATPTGAPDLSRLEQEPYIDSSTGEEIGGRPTVCISFDNKETDLFVEFTQHTTKLVDGLNIQQNGWLFVETALSYFVKSFFTQGLDQLLWHITTIEALVGEKGEGVTERLARRIASILGTSEADKKQWRKQFKELYTFRSDLVHGSQFQKEIDVGHLRNARTLARQLLVWFLHYLNQIQSDFPANLPSQHIPNREDLLALLDMDQDSRHRLRLLIERLPQGFPSIPGWIT